jgi:hypothetical protein
MQEWESGKTPTLLPCSRNARPQKGLVRRPQLEQHGCPAAMKLKPYKKRGKRKESGQVPFLLAECAR